MNTVPRIKPAAVQPAGADRIDPLEWETRVDLAACYRLVDLFGMCDLHLNHISARVPGQEEHFLINPFGMMLPLRSILISDDAVISSYIIPKGLIRKCSS